ncbi:MAG: hypothetical protein ACHQCF_05145, partial [Solirubrobacterales bacterium]
VRVDFPESTPFQAGGPLIVFNGGQKGGVAKLLIHAYVSVPAPTAIVSTVKISKEHKSPYNLHTVASVPVIAGGAGSLIHFELTINRRGYILAKCNDGIFFAKTTARFRGGGEVSGAFTRPCTGIG